MQSANWLSLSEAENAAQAVLDHGVWAYLAGGAGLGGTVGANIDAFRWIWLQPGLMRASGALPDLRVRILGRALSMPVLLAPTSPQRLFHEDAELATARAASRAGTLSIVSADSHFSFPQVARASDGSSWFQLYAYRSRDHIQAMVELAEESGAMALVITVDACHPARRLSVRRAGFRTPPGVDFGTLRLLGVLNGDVPSDARLERIPLGWTDLAWIRRLTRLPLLVKGVLRAADADRCFDEGADGIVVSNHGGRQLDCVVPSLIALEQVAAKVWDRGVILMDGGVRSGLDVIKALALGAHAVCIGRPYLWGLAVGGQQGVEEVLGVLKAEMEDALLQLGLESIGDVGPSCLSSMKWHAPSGESAVRRETALVHAAHDALEAA